MHGAICVLLQSKQELCCTEGSRTDCYLHAGKVHKKFVLLAHSDSPLAAAVVEGHRFSYIYRKTASKQGSGESQVRHIFDHCCSVLQLAAEELLVCEDNSA